MIPTSKQKEALILLTDDITEFVGYGGAAGGGKTYLGCWWLMQLGYYAAGTKYFIGRNDLKETRESVLHSWRKLAKEINFTDWRYNDNHIYFSNGSEIEFLDLTYYPQKDPLYDRFGSKEYTCGWIEEAASVHYMAFEVLKTRIGRWLNKEYNIKKKIFCTFNPRKSWVDSFFYRPYKNNSQSEFTKFVPALATDNPYLSPDYIETLKNLKDKATKERLLYGNFDYEDDPTSLIEYDSIINLFTNNYVKDGIRYIVCDVARYGSDNAIVTVWSGLKLIDYYKNNYTSTTDLQNVINNFKYKYQVQNSNIIADEDGVGGGLVDIMKIKGFIAQKKSVIKNYASMKDECGYKLAEKIKEIYIACEIPPVEKEIIIEELSMLKTYDADKDNDLKILPKKYIKELINRSPDWLDCFIMRMYFETKRSTFL